MSSYVQFQRVAPDGTRYPTPDAMAPSSVTFLYPSAQPVSYAPAPPPLSNNGQSYVICQAPAMARRSNDEVFYVLTPAASYQPPPPQQQLMSGGGTQLATIMRSNNSSASNVSMSNTTTVPYAPKELYMFTPTPSQAVPCSAPPYQQQTVHMSYAPPMHRSPLPPPPPMMNVAAKQILMRSPEVCRHYINGRCNRRKCRFLHADLRTPIRTSAMTYADSIVTAAAPTPQDRAGATASAFFVQAAAPPQSPQQRH